MIVFMTAYGEYALKAFGHAAADYVLKPVQAARLGMHGRAAAIFARGRGQHGAAPRTAPGADGSARAKPRTQA